MTAKPISIQYNHQKIPILGIVVETASSAPSSPVDGQMYYDTVALRGYIRENGAWVLMSDTGVELLANKGVASGYASLDGSTKVPIAQVPTGSTGSTVPFGNDSRFSDQRVPTDGSVTGGAAGTGVKIAASTITIDNIAAALKDAADATTSLRMLGYTATKAMPGVARLDQIAAPTASVSLNSQRITGLLASASATDAVNRAELDAARQGLAGAKDPVIVDALVNVNLASPGATIHGVTLSNTGIDRFLAPAQTTGTENGIYIWNGAAVPATRALDDDATGEVQDGTTVAVAQGANAGYLYIQTATPSGAPGAWTQTWTVYNTGGITYTGSNGILLTGTNFTAVKDTTDATNPISISSNGIKVGTVPVDHGGTGATTAAGARTGIGATGVYAADMVALSAGVEVTVTHSLNTTDTVESFKVVSTGIKTDLGVRTIGVNSIGVTSDVAYSAGAIRIVVVG